MGHFRVRGGLAGMVFRAAKKSSGERTSDNENCQVKIPACQKESFHGVNCVRRGVGVGQRSYQFQITFRSDTAVTAHKV